jgi:hypothetical protein
MELPQLQVSSIPKSRADLYQLIEANFTKLSELLNELEDRHWSRPCDESFTVKEIVAIRLWWTRAVCKWVKSSGSGRSISIPASGYTWRQTPELNLSIAAQSSKQTPKQLMGKLKLAKKNVLLVLDELSDKELTNTGVYDWCGKWPIMRWVSVNTSSQYAGAYRLIKKAIK